MKVMIKFSKPLPCGCLSAVHTGFTARGEATVKCLPHFRRDSVPCDQVTDWGEKAMECWRNMTQVQRNILHQKGMTGVDYHPEGEK